MCTCVCVHGCVHVYTCVFVYMGACTCTHVCSCTWMCTCVCVHGCAMRVCVHVCTCVFVHGRVYCAHACLCTWVCTCVHGHVHAWDSLAYVCTEAEVDAVPSSIASPFHFLSQCLREPGAHCLCQTSCPVSAGVCLSSELPETGVQKHATIPHSTQVLWM